MRNLCVNAGAARGLLAIAESFVSRNCCFRLFYCVGYICCGRVRSTVFLVIHIMGSRAVLLQFTAAGLSCTFTLVICEQLNVCCHNNPANLADAAQRLLGFACNLSIWLLSRRATRRRCD